MSVFFGFRWYDPSSAVALTPLGNLDCVLIVFESPAKGSETAWAAAWAAATEAASGAVPDRGAEFPAATARPESPDRTRPPGHLATTTVSSSSSATKSRQRSNERALSVRHSHAGGLVNAGRALRGVTGRRDRSARLFIILFGFSFYCGAVGARGAPWVVRSICKYVQYVLYCLSFCIICIFYFLLSTVTNKCIFLLVRLMALLFYLVPLQAVSFSVDHQKRRPIRKNVWI